MIAIKEMMEKIWEVAKVGGKAFITFIKEASLSTLIKYGLVAGLAIGAIVLLFKFIKDKINSYRVNAAHKSVVDRALDLNYYDHRNIEKLGKEMKELKKALNYYSKKRANKQKEEYKRNVHKYGKHIAKRFSSLLHYLNEEEGYDFDDDYYSYKNRNDAWGSVADRLRHQSVNDDLYDFVDNYQEYIDNSNKYNNHKLVDIFHGVYTPDF